MQVVDDRLQAGPIAGAPRAALRLAMGAQLLRARITADLADQASEVRVGSFDPATGETVLGTATSGTLGPGQGRDGPSLLCPLLDPAREHVGHESSLTEPEARQVAETLSLAARAAVRARGRHGPGRSVAAGRLARDHRRRESVLRDTYSVVEATHRFDLERGYLTDFHAEGALSRTGP